MRLWLGGKCGQKKAASHAHIEQTPRRRYNTGAHSGVYRNFNAISAATSIFHARSRVVVTHALIFRNVNLHESMAMTAIVCRDGARYKAIRSYSAQSPISVDETMPGFT